MPRLLSAQVFKHSKTNAAMTLHLQKVHGITQAGQPAQHGDIREEIKRMKLPPERQERLEHLMARGFVSAGIPPNAANNDDLREFFYELNSAFRAPRSDALTVRADEVHVKLREFMLSDLKKNARYMSITTDAATTVAGDELIAVTGHYITPDWTLQSVLLALADVDQSKTAVFLDNLLSDIQAQWGHECVITCTTGTRARAAAAAAVAS